jgi:hypothetical protein
MNLTPTPPPTPHPHTYFEKRAESLKNGQIFRLVERCLHRNPLGLTRESTEKARSMTPYARQLVFWFIAGHHGHVLRYSIPTSAAYHGSFMVSGWKKNIELMHSRDVKTQ